jgi:integrase
LRILEAASVRLRDLDLEQGTVTIADTPWHSVKTHASKRTVPVPAHGLEYVRRHLTRLDAWPVPDGPLFTTRAGKPWGLESLKSAWQTLTGKRSDREGMNVLAALALPAGFTPSECRATFATLARRSGCDSRLVECCMGHAGRSVLARHYEGVGLGDLRQVADAVQRVLETACLSHACPTVERMESAGP